MREPKKNRLGSAIYADHSRFSAWVAENGAAGVVVMYAGRKGSREASVNEIFAHPDCTPYNPRALLGGSAQNSGRPLD